MKGCEKVNFKFPAVESAAVVTSQIKTKTKNFYLKTEKVNFGSENLLKSCVEKFYKCQCDQRSESWILSTTRGKTCSGFSPDTKMSKENVIKCALRPKALCKLPLDFGVSRQRFWTLPCFSRRIEEHLVHRLEFDDRGQPANLVKEFRRSAAGHIQAKPSDLRPPQVCLRTAQHLIEK